MRTPFVRRRTALLLLTLTTLTALLATPAAAGPAYGGYLFLYFTGEGTATGEQIYLAASRGNDPVRFDELNARRPVLTSTLGDKGVRDPFIIRSPQGDRFYLLATDLRSYGNGNWEAAQRRGSKNIEVWESTDLVHWSAQRHVRVSPDTAGNTWAPEAYWDRTINAYVVFWASKLYAANDPNHTGNTYNRMLYASGQWSAVTSYALPASPRHGTVLPVTAAELARVRAAFP